MANRAEQARAGETAVVVRYWASARDAAGCVEEQVVLDGPIPVGALIERLTPPDRPGGARLREILQACSVAVDGSIQQDHGTTGPPVVAGGVVEFLPPFAGG